MQAYISTTHHYIQGNYRYVRIVTLEITSSKCERLSKKIFQTFTIYILGHVGSIISKHLWFIIKTGSYLNVASIQSSIWFFGKLFPQVFLQVVLHHGNCLKEPKKEGNFL